MTLQQELADLLTRYGMTQARAAEFICRGSDRPCSVRAVRAWLADPSKPSARPCPEWALIALRRALGYPNPLIPAPRDLDPLHAPDTE
ncbi:hypothetical protein [Aeromonas veronii]|uniref:hypothetical protein n=1 Tax=Aeromonas veronii TaxID=654 RepID=UPI001F305C48|nr:hypothetical protein [Aeromonas veronii]MCF5901486.1 hypothetical protein [Aeromonas veronii]